MATSGPNFPSTVVDDATVGTLAWTNPANAEVDDGVFATRSLSSISTSHYLKATGFGFSIPSGATINGILAEVKVKGADGLSRDNSIRLVQGGVISGTDLSAGVSVTTTLAYRSFGGPSNLWGLSWTNTDINSSTFGFCYGAARGSAESASTMSVDAMRLTITYTTTGGVVATQTSVLQAVQRAAVY
jgi:hypothetical protein